MKTIETLKDIQKGIESDISIIKSQLNNKNEEVRKVRIEIWQIETGLTLGDDVLFDEKTGATKAKLTALDIRYTYPRPEVTLYKKDGSLGRRVKNYGLKNLRKA